MHFDLYYTITYIYLYIIDVSYVGNMMADYTRTGTYQKAMYNNSKDFEHKIVLDVGTGSGILAFFALQGIAIELIYITYT